VSYVQFFRSGVIEGVAELNSRDQDGAPYFVGHVLASKVVFAWRQYLTVLKAFNAGLPVYALLSLCNVNRCYFRGSSPDGVGWNDEGPLGREVVAFPEVSISNADEDASAVMRPIFNMLWNAFGFPRCDRYDSLGKWIERA
jgi:hypothetical protein